MISEIIILNIIWMLLFLLIGFIIHVWTQIDGIQKVAVFSTSAIVAAVICSCPLFI